MGAECCPSAKPAVRRAGAADDQTLVRRAVLVAIFLTLSHVPATGTRASPPLESDIGEVADAGGVRVVAVAEHGDIDQVSGCGILPDLCIDAGEIDPLVEPAADPVVAGVGNKVRKATDVFVVPRFEPIAPDHLHGALLAAVGDEPKKEPRRVIVAFARALVERALDLQFDVPAPREHRVGGEIDIDLAKQHRRAVTGFEPQARHPVLDPKGHRHRRTRPEFPMSPAGGERIERKASPKIHHGHDRLAVGFQYLASPAQKLPADQTDGGNDEQDASDREVAKSPGHSTPVHLWHRPRSSLGNTFMSEYPVGFIRIRTRRTRRRWRGSPASWRPTCRPSSTRQGKSDCQAEAALAAGREGPR